MWVVLSGWALRPRAWSRPPVHATIAANRGASYSSSSYVKGVRVELKKASHSIVMHPNYDCDWMADDFTVVYADSVNLHRIWWQFPR